MKYTGVKFSQRYRISPLVLCVQRLLLANTLSSKGLMQLPKMVDFVVKRYAVCKAKKWRYAVRKAKIGWYPVQMGGGGATLFVCEQNQHTFSLVYYMKLTPHYNTYSHHETLCISPVCVNPVLMHDHMQSARTCKYLKLKLVDRRKCH